MIARKYLSEDFLKGVKRIIIVPEDKREGYKYLAEEVVENEPYAIWWTKKKVYKKGFYNDKSEYITEKYQGDFILKDEKVYHKAYIRIFYDDPTDIDTSEYITADSNEKALEIFNRFAEKVNLVEYS